jgi:uncharacterized protein with GYD domain
MATYITLGSFTEQGIKNVKQTEHRAEIIRKMAEKHGIQVKEFYWILGPYDIGAILDAPSEEAVTKLMLAIGEMGNVRTQTFRAFTESEIVSITKAL